MAEVVPLNPSKTSASKELYGIGETPPLGVVLDSYDHVSALAPRIRKVAVDAEIMPLGNTTGMTRAERRKLGDWIAAGTPR